MKLTTTAPICLGLSLVSYSALAQEGQGCATDADCDTGYRCESNKDQSAASDSTEALPPASDAGTPTRIAASGTCQPDHNLCVSDADCAEGYVCNMDLGVDAPGPNCPPNQPCPDVEPVTYGECQAPPLVCETTSDCPEPAQCSDNGTCEYYMELCETDADCAENYECLLVQQEMRCWAEDNVPAGIDPATLTLADDGLLCQDSSFALCFPPVDECQTDADCEHDWICAHVEPGGPDEWANVDMSCMPPALKLLMNGDIPVNEESRRAVAKQLGVEDEISTTETVSANGSTSTGVAMQNVSAPTSDPNATAATDAEQDSNSEPSGDTAKTDDGASDGKSAHGADAGAPATEPNKNGVSDNGGGGCSVGKLPGSNPSASWTLLLALALLPWRRRRH